MQVESVLKPKNYFRVKPNFPDYESSYNKYSWNKVRGELEWFENGKINAAYNAIDRHLTTFRKNKIALYWEGSLGQTQKFTFEDIAVLSNKFGNYLKKLGIERGDRVFIFLPRIPYLYIAFLGILKIGAIAGTLFSAFQEQALFDRLENSQAKVLITDEALVDRVRNIRKKLPHLKHVITVNENFAHEIEKEQPNLHIARMDEDDYAFMLYTSGTTGKPKGVVHRHLAVLCEHMTAKYVLDLHDEDTYWCTADPGWVTGIAYEILGSWSCGVTSVIYEGRFDPAKWYEILEKYGISVWYTAPTAIRMLMAEGYVLVKKYNLSKLRHLLSVGEPLNPEGIKWGLKAFGLPFHDTWWQTETGAICIANYPSMKIKIGSMGKPFPGITAEIVDDHGHKLPAGQEGNLALKAGWPSMMKTIWQRHVKYESYFLPASRHGKNGWYISGDRGWKDKDGYFWFVGRADDVIKTSGERVGPFEVESALVAHPAVVEAGVIGKPDKLRGEIIKAFVVLKENPKDAEKLKEELSLYVKKHLAGHAYPREVEFIDKLPKTRSGKIMRRILKAKELGLPIGDTSTLEEY